ncbi:MAG: DNA/RNA nuclease SfsA [Proteobacteria bacterium]|nr:DNA/RNA nuclease SfsA [Pseudomonadota bacterium]MBU1709416.1 DNA/RNA nuclease SfsA [Pseudomonadota bacterium]
MKFEKNLHPATLIKRYKRFLADVEMPDRNITTVHCPNSGSMMGLCAAGNDVMLSTSDNPKRKYPRTLEMIKVGGNWVGINTMRTNPLVREAIERGKIHEIGIVDTIQPEVTVSDRSRLDFLLKRGNQQIYLEVKNCTLAENGIAMFPDAVTTRGTKHLEELISLKKAGHLAMVLFCVQRADAAQFSPAAHIDPLYAETLARACQQGVQALAYQADVSPQAIEIIRRLEIILPDKASRSNNY